MGGSPFAKAFRAALLVLAGVVALGGRPAVAATHVLAPDFSAVDQFGRPFALAEHAGHPLVLFFGYSHCGDVCPITLVKLERAKSALGFSARSLQVVFVTVDPRRDKPAVLRRFIGSFDPSFIALTGSTEQLSRVDAAYHVTHRVLAASRRSEDYDVEHSSFLYFIGRDRRLRGFGDWTDSQQIVTENVAELLSPRADRSPPNSGR